MRPLRGLTWGGTAYLVGVIVAGAVLLPVTVVFFPLHRSAWLSMAYLALFSQLAALMPIQWRRGKQTLDSMPLVAASLLAPGLGPVLLSWLCKNDGRWPSADLPIERVLFNRARSAIEFGLPSMALTFLPLPPELDIPAKTMCLAAGNLLIGYPLTGKAVAEYERESFWRVLAANVGIASTRSVLILGIGGGALYMILQLPGGYVMGLGLLGLLFAVRSNMADAQQQSVERIQTLELMAQALDARDTMTELHSQRVSNLAAQIAQALGMNQLEIERIRVAGLLHDIGKIGVPDSVLKKPAALDPDEWVAMRRHAEVGAEMIARHSALVSIAPWVKHHHERWNGSGYPSGLIGESIPMGARILAVADSFDTITGPRIYRQSSLGAEDAVLDISSGAGNLYDPAVVNALRQLHNVEPIALTTAPTSEAKLIRSVTMLRDNRALRALASGMSISSLGDPLTAVAITVSAYMATHNGLGVGVALMLRAAAMMAAGFLVGGALDHWPRRQVVVASDLVQFAMLAVTPLLISIASWAVFLVVPILGAATALGQAGRDAGVSTIVESPHLGVANSLIATGTTLGRSVGYPLAAVIIAIGWSVGRLYTVDAVTFLLAAVLTAWAGPIGGGGVSRRIGGAVRAAFRFTPIRPALLLAGAGAFLLSMTIPAVIVVAYELSPLRGSRTYTVLEVVITAGMVIGALASARLAANPRAAVLIGFASMGALSVGVATSSFLLVTGLCLFVASVGNQFYFVGNRTELQQLAPRDQVGSVMAARAVLVQTMAVVGTGAGGLVSSIIGGRLTYGLTGLALIAVVGAVMVARLASATVNTRRIDRRSRPAEPAQTRASAIEVSKSA